jgi:hypothetical protein
MGLLCGAMRRSALKGNGFLGKQAKGNLAIVKGPFGLRVERGAAWGQGWQGGGWAVKPVPGEGPVRKACGGGKTGDMVGAVLRV